MKSTVLFLRLGIFLVTTGIILGAFGAHALKEVFTSYELDIWEKGIFYQISNGLGLILIVLLTNSNLIKKKLKKYKAKIVTTKQKNHNGTRRVPEISNNFNNAYGFVLFADNP